MTLLECILLLIMVETPNCPCGSETHCFCVGDNGKSHGCLQITEAYMEDVNEYHSMDYVFPDDCYDMQTSIDIAMLYMARWAHPSRIGRAVVFDDIARIHNGGPSGHLKISATQPYIEKARLLLDGR
jgi:hypothetical protein